MRLISAGYCIVGLYYSLLPFPSVCGYINAVAETIAKGSRLVLRHTEVFLILVVILVVMAAVMAAGVVIKKMHMMHASLKRCLSNTSDSIWRLGLMNLLNIHQS